MSLQNGISLVKESALSVLTACAETMELEFKKFSNDFIPVLM